MRIVYLITGYVSLLLGIVGIFLPILPTTPFVLLAAYCFTRSSTRMSNWLQNSRFGPMILQWQHDRSLSPVIKKRAIFMIVLSFGVSIVFFIDVMYLRFLMMLVAVMLITYILRIPSKDSILVEKS